VDYPVETAMWPTVRPIAIAIADAERCSMGVRTMAGYLDVDVSDGILLVEIATEDASV